MQNMSKLKLILSSPQFWVWFLFGSLIAFGVETFFLGMWAIPFLDYSIPFMNEVTSNDLIFSAAFAILFAFGLALLVLSRRANNLSCAIGSSAGLTTLFTLLCPVCPIFFLTYFGLSSSVILIAPYFWWLRLAAVILLLVGTVIIWKRFSLSKLPAFNWTLAFEKFAVVMIAVLFFSNQALSMQIGMDLVGSETNDGQIALSGDFANDVANMVTPTSLPFYGPELGLDFSNINAINTSIKKLAMMAPKQGSNPIELTDEEMERYVKIGTEPLVTCEFCCGVKTLVREDGTPTCGCAHSIAMRGTAAYILRNYPEKTNEEISYELMRQKGLYFPKQMQKRMASLLAGEPADFTADIKYLTQNLTEAELADLKEKAQNSGFEPGDAPGMVGGC